MVFAFVELEFFTATNAFQNVQFNMETSEVFVRNVMKTVLLVMDPNHLAVNA